MLAQTVLASLFATVALAVPTPPHASNGMPLPVAKESKVEKWTTVDLSRKCNKDDTECIWDFSIDTHNPNSESPYHCQYKVTGEPASETDGVPTMCKVLRIATGYDKGGKFTVLTAVHPPTNRMIYAGFDDSLLADGKVVPDKDWEVEPVPGTEKY